MKNRRKIENSRKREKGVAITASEKRERLVVISVYWDEPIRLQDFFGLFCLDQSD